MTPRFRVLCMAGLAAALSTGVVAQTGIGAADSPTRDRPDKKQVVKQAKIGQPAPDFKLRDPKGKIYKLSDYKGKIVVLQWINPGCPVCNRVIQGSVVKKMHKDVRSIDENVVFLAINSTKGMEGSKSAEYFKKNKIKVPTLIDSNGKVGRLYAAKRTPHMYVIDTEGVLRYNGAIDDDRSGAKGDEATNYVVSAVRQISYGETVMPDSTRAYGCTVKYGDSGSKKKKPTTRRGGG